MQHRSRNLPVRGLPALWGGYLLGQLDTDIRGLNRALPIAPNDRPFEFLQNPSPYPPKGVPKTFERILNEGHWPDNNAYDEPSLNGSKFNLFERVATHLPGSQDWLFTDLKRPAQELPHDVRAIQEAIDRALNRFGLARVHPAASLLIVECLNRHDPSLVEQLYLPTWQALVESGEPLHTTLLTLMWQEFLCYQAPTFADTVEVCCRMAWTRLLRRRELRKDPALLAKGVRAIRNMLHFIRMTGPITPASRIKSKVHIYMPMCPVWKRTEDGEAVELILARFHYDFVLRTIKAGRRGPLRPKEPVRPLPEQVESALHTVLQGIVQARNCWATWNLEAELKQPRGRVPP